MKIEQVLGTSNITTKDGKTLKKTQFLSEGQVYFTFSEVKAGDEREEVGRKQFNKQDGTIETTINFKPSGKGNWQGNKSDPKTMILSYAKDLTVAQISANELKGSENIVQTCIAFADRLMKWYEGKKESKPTPVNVDKNEVGIDDIPFGDNEG